MRSELKAGLCEYEADVWPLNDTVRSLHLLIIREIPPRDSQSKVSETDVLWDAGNKSIFTRV